MRTVSSKRALWAAAAFVLALSGVASAQGNADPDHAGSRTIFVTILQNRIRPEVQTVPAGHAFGWLNYSDEIARVSFDKDVAKHLTCKSQGSFRLTGDRLESGDIQAQQFATLCNLAPGEYTYRVDLRPGVGTGSGDVGQSRTGRLVVQ
jgi:hypothetical protein